MKYEEMLKRALEKLPERTSNGERFEVPVADVSLQGNRTCLKNLAQIAGVFRREPRHLLRFLLKELATSGDIENNQGIFQGKLSQHAIDRKIQEYANGYVICPECKRPDTKLIKEQRVTMLKCEACGAKHSVGQI